MRAGGGSGGGSINIFAQESITRGTILATGGAGGEKYYPTGSGGPGGSGGKGSISLGIIEEGIYVPVQ